MNVNVNFDERVSVHADTPWVASPMAGVERRMLDRIGDEVARATTIVRFAPGSAFSPHVHTGGEEFLVLDGVFQDEHGDFPTGSYIRNPPQSSHTPATAPGCTIFVKLWQFDLADRTHVRIDTNKARYLPTADGVKTLPLFQDEHEDVVMEVWDAETKVDLSAHAGMEVLVLSGNFVESDEEFAPQSWLRLPKGAGATAQAGPGGAKVWIKRDHLKTPPQAPVV